MLKGWQGGTGAVIVTLGTVALISLDLADRGFRLWWLTHAFTTDTVAGVLVVLLTVLVVDQVVRRRQILDRARAISAQAVILVAQASRAEQAVSGVLTGSGEGDRDAAGDSVRTYMIMLMVAAPVLIDAKISRTFLEEAQRLGGELAHALASLGRDGSPPSTARIDAAAQRLRDASGPLMDQLTPEERTALNTDISP